MKKLLIIFFVLSFSTKAHAIKFSKCYPIDGSTVATKFENDKFEKWEYKLIDNGVQEKIIFTESFLKKINRKHDEFIKKEREKGYNTPHSYKEKIEIRYFQIDLIDEKYIRAKEEDYVDVYSGRTKISYQKTFDLSTGEVSSKTVFEYATGGKKISDGYTLKCSINKSKGSSSYLDYWWAVILIIAITFFIFTQSGKRLKKIRRK
tara:strand:+ start:332 stop:946 length:615 start_codon:yes stop_codon:yes gene_type:complete